MQEIPKQLKHQVREWAGIARRSRLTARLSVNFAIEFDRWERGEIDSFALNERVHRFHQDAVARDLEEYATTQH